jgi:hypothetical protein
MLLLMTLQRAYVLTRLSLDTGIEEESGGEAGEGRGSEKDS